jgi:hypothetical protein
MSVSKHQHDLESILKASKPHFDQNK